MDAAYSYRGKFERRRIASYIKQIFIASLLESLGANLLSSVDAEDGLNHPTDGTART